MSLVEKELPSLREHIISSSVFSGIRAAQSLIFCLVFVLLCFYFGHCYCLSFMLAIVIVCLSSIYGFWLSPLEGTMVLNTIFNTISVISWRTVLLVEQTGVPGEDHRPTGSHWQTLSHNIPLWYLQIMYLNNDRRTSQNMLNININARLS